ncbi:MAG TPA: hypothetical protein VFB73_09130 [Chloroflexota bacterium]|nr:hypothetical protein [Chloroflexota bacterium]
MDSRPTATHEPQVQVIPLADRTALAAGQWQVRWRLTNAGPQPLHILSTWLPHSRFRGAEQAFDPPLTLAPGASRTLELAVACHEPPGTVVENAFLILRVLWGAEPWRILARLRVVVDPAGGPVMYCERITTQPVGFAPQGA